MLLLLMLVGMLLETLGIGLVIPALALMTRDNVAERYPRIVPLLRWLGNPNREHLVVLGMLVLVGMHAVKTAFLALLAWWQMSFVGDVQAQLSQRLFAGYLHQPYSFHLQRNSAQLINNATGEVSLFAQTCVLAGLSLLTELLVVIGISALLLFVAPVGAMVVGATLGLPALAFHRLTHMHILRWGEARQLHEGMRIQHLQQGLGAVKEVKLLGRESSFLGQYEQHNLGSARVLVRSQMLQQLPRLALEFLAMCGLAGLVIVMIGQDKPLDAVLPTLGLFAAAAFRMLPSANRAVGAIQNVRYALPVVDTLYREMQLLNLGATAAPATKFPYRESLALDNVTFQYEGAERPCLLNLSLSVASGSSIGIVGGSGAGKSTLIDVILGLLAPRTGSVRVDGIDIQSNLRGWQNRIGYVPQSIFLTDDSLRRNVAFGVEDSQIDDAAVWRAIRAAQLERFVAELPMGIDTPVGERGVRLSGGQLQRVGIARALYHDPAILVLDEATSALDTATEQEVMSAVRGLHGCKTTIIVAHRLSTVQYCDQLLQLEDGRVVAVAKSPDRSGDVNAQTGAIAR